MSADDAGAAVLDDVSEILGGEPVVDRDQHRSQLRYRIKRLQLRMGVGGDVGDTVAAAHGHVPLQDRRPAVAAIKELLVGQPQIAIHDRLPVAIEHARPPRELQRCHRRFHRAVLLTSVSALARGAEVRGPRRSRKANSHPGVRDSAATSSTAPTPCAVSLRSPLPRPRERRRSLHAFIVVSDAPETITGSQIAWLPGRPFRAAPTGEARVSMAVTDNPDMGGGFKPVRQAELTTERRLRARLPPAADYAPLSQLRLRF